MTPATHPTSASPALVLRPDASHAPRGVVGAEFGNIRTLALCLADLARAPLDTTMLERDHAAYKARLDGVIAGWDAPTIEPHNLVYHLGDAQ